MKDMVPDQVYSAAEVAEYLKCSPRLVYRMAASGKLPSFPLGRLRRFRGRDILRFVEGRMGGEMRGFTSVGADLSSPPAVRSDQLYTVEEVAKLLRVDVADVMANTKSGELPGFRVGMAWRYWGHDLLRLGHTKSSTAEPERAPEDTPQGD